jgi:hypothetical protein
MSLLQRQAHAFNLLFAPTKSLYRQSVKPLLFMKHCSAALNASDIRLDTNSKCIAIVAMQINKAT